MKQRKLNDSTVSKTLPVIPDDPPPDPGKVVEILCVPTIEVFVFIDIVDVAFIFVEFVVVIDFVSDVGGGDDVAEQAPFITKEK